MDEEDWEDVEPGITQELIGITASELGFTLPPQLADLDTHSFRSARRRSPLICPIYNVCLSTQTFNLLLP